MSFHILPWFQTNQHFLLLFNTTWLMEKHTNFIVFLVWSDWGLNPRSNALEVSITNHYTTGQVHFWLRYLYQVNEVSDHVYVYQGYRFCLVLQFFNCIPGTVPTVMYFYLIHFIPSNENYFLLAILYRYLPACVVVVDGMFCNSCSRLYVSICWLRTIKTMKMLQYIPERSDKREITHILFYKCEYTNW